MTEEPEMPEEKASSSQVSRPKKKDKKDRLRGFAGLIKSQLDSVNSMPQFKVRYAPVDLKVLLVATDMFPAALVLIDHGELKVSAVPETECKNYKKTGAHALLQCTTEQFLAIAKGKLAPRNAWLHRQIKLRGPRKLLQLYKLFTLLSKSKLVQ